MNESKMNRGLKNRHLQLISLGGVIGSGYFLGTGYVLEKAGPAAILAYLLGGVIVLCVMLCLAELAVEKPVSGSFVTYAREHISPTWACGVGWAYWTTWVAYVPSEMIAAGIIMNNFIPEVSQLWWAVFFGLLVTILNLFHVDKFGESEFWLSLIKIIALAAFSIVAGLICLGLIGDQGYIGTKVLLGSERLLVDRADDGHHPRQLPGHGDYRPCRRRVREAGEEHPDCGAQRDMAHHRALHHPNLAPDLHPALGQGGPR